MPGEDELRSLQPDHLLDGGALDCGSGLVLLIREHMQQVPEGGVLEMRSLEPTVRDDLPPWCRMVGHEFLGALPGETRDQQRYFVRRGSGAQAQAEQAALAADKARARDYEWRLRARASGSLKTTVYCRNFQWALGQPASFEERDEHPSAVEALLGALAGDLLSGFAVACSRAGLEVDDLELTAKGRLHDVMAHLGLDAGVAGDPVTDGDAPAGDPSFAAIDLKLFASTFDDEAAVRAVFAETLRRAPLFNTLRKATQLNAKLAIV